MSTRTVIEINHDHLHWLKGKPEEVMRFIRYLGLSQGEAEKVAPNGIKVLGQRHHSEKLRLTFESPGATRTTSY